MAIRVFGYRPLRVNTVARRRLKPAYCCCLPQSGERVREPEDGAKGSADCGYGDYL